MTYWRKNRMTKARIELYHHNSSGKRNDSSYTLFCCVHKFETKDYKHRSDALAAMARPWEWCEKCKEKLDGSQ